MNEKHHILSYPLSENFSKYLSTSSGLSLDEINMESLMQGKLSAEDFCIRDETLRAQAAIARQSGFEKLADNLLRAAELTRVPNTDILKMYEALRPGRSSYEELVILAETLENKYEAPLTAGFIREAVQVYQVRGLLKRHSE